MDEAKRLKHVLALEITRIVDDLSYRRDFLIEMWSRHRDRGPFLDTVHSRWQTLAIFELTQLDEETNTLLDTFYRELSDLSLFFQFTEDMPTQLSLAYDQCLARIKAVAEPTLKALDAQIARPELPPFDESVWERMDDEQEGSEPQR